MDDALRARVRETGASVFQPAKPLAAAGKVLLKENLTNAAELERVLGS
jgi:hypothetical protein